ncbi:hypothetical protein MNV49_006635 [Pseudohyphozyma bogoriensis]|nr:hypothetical protein MNV49_006635 [Pseudohyphozyma bogoriensis]
MSSAVVAYFIWWWWHRLVDPSQVYKEAATWTAAFALIAFASFLGLIGTLLPGSLRLFVVLYEWTLGFALLFAIAGGTWVVVKVWQLKSFIAYECSTSPEEKMNKCTIWYEEGEVAFTALFIILTLFNLYLFSIIVRYVAQLKEEHREKEATKKLAWLLTIPSLSDTFTSPPREQPTVEKLETEEQV